VDTKAALTAGRIIGALILAQMVGGFLVNFGLTGALHGSPGFLVSAAPHATQIAISVLLGLVEGAIPVGIAIVAFPLFRRHSGAGALWLLVLASVGFAGAVLEQINVMSMLSLSQAYAAANAVEQERFQALRGVVAASRNWSHFVGLIVSGSTILVRYAILLRFALVPRVLAAFGVAAVLLQVGVVAMPLFGQEVVFGLLAPLGVSELLLSMWLLARGLREPAAASD
jgi:hypothetical protein